MGVSATKTSVYIIHQKQALITVTSENSDLRVTLFILYSHTLFIQAFLVGVVWGGGGGGVFSTYTL